MYKILWCCSYLLPSACPSHSTLRVPCFPHLLPKLILEWTLYCIHLHSPIHWFTCVFCILAIVYESCRQIFLGEADDQELPVPNNPQWIPFWLSAWTEVRQLCHHLLEEGTKGKWIGIRLQSSGKESVKADSDSKTSPSTWPFVCLWQLGLIFALNYWEEDMPGRWGHLIEKSPHFRQQETLILAANLLVSFHRHLFPALDVCLFFQVRWEGWTKRFLQSLTDSEITKTPGSQTVHLLHFWKWNVDLSDG